MGFVSTPSRKTQIQIIKLTYVTNFSLLSKKAIWYMQDSVQYKSLYQAFHKLNKGNNHKNYQKNVILKNGPKNYSVFVPQLEHNYGRSHVSPLKNHYLGKPSGSTICTTVSLPTPPGKTWQYFGSNCCMLYPRAHNLHFIQK